MVCPQCGSVMDPSDVFCGNCGAKNVSAIIPQATVQTVERVVTPNPQVEQVTSFFKNSFMGIVRAILIKPIKGTFDIFHNAGHEAYQHAIILMATTGLAYFLLPFLFLSKMLGNEGLAIFLKVGIIVVTIQFIISLLTFFIKGLSGKPDFKRELLTGGICGIPMIIWCIYLCFFGSNAMGLFGGFDNFSQLGILGISLSLYVLLMLINIIQQSLKASGTNDAMSWYAAPIILIASTYVGVRVMSALLFQGY